MGKLLSHLVFVVMFVLLIPTGLVLASQDAVPGDSTYPVKRQLENIIVTIAAVHPATRAYFNIDFSQRRYNESTKLIARGRDDQAIESLSEVDSQTNQAVQEILAISDTKRRKELAQQLIQKIKERNERLAQLQTEVAQREAARELANAPSQLNPTPTPFVSSGRGTPRPTQASGVVVVIVTPTNTPTPIRGPSVTSVPQQPAAPSTPSVTGAIGGTINNGNTATTILEPVANSNSVPGPIPTPAVGGFEAGGNHNALTAGGNAISCTPGAWNPLVCGTCKADGKSYNPCEDAAWQSRKTSDTAAYCQCAMNCGLEVACRTNPTCVGLNMCTASTNAADGPGDGPGSTSAPAASGDECKDGPYSCGYSTSEWEKGNCPCGGTFNRIVSCSTNQIIRYESCSCNACQQAAATPTPASPGPDCPGFSNEYLQCLGYKLSSGVNATCYTKGTTTATRDVCYSGCGSCP